MYCVLINTNVNNFYNAIRSGFQKFIGTAAGLNADTSNCSTLAVEFPYF